MFSTQLLDFLYNFYTNPNVPTRYAIPVVGSTFRSLDQYGDYQKMQADYTRNVGRKILYPSIRGYQANAYSSMGTAFNSVLSGAGRTVRSLI